MPLQVTEAEVLSDFEREQAVLASRPSRLARAIAGASTDRLLRHLNAKVARHSLFDAKGFLVIPPGASLPVREQSDIEDALALGAELCRRGVAPVWRDVRWFCSAQHEQPPFWHDESADLLALALDVQWVIHRWPRHKPAWERAEGVFNPKTFWPALKYLHHGGRRPPGQLAVALALTPDQQAELCFVRSISVGRRVCWMWRHQAEARKLITAQVRAEDQRSQAEQDVTIERRHRVWMAGHLVGGKPTRTAELLALRPDAETLRRSTVGRDWAKVRDLCRSDPRPVTVEEGAPPP